MLKDKEINTIFSFLNKSGSKSSFRIRLQNLLIAMCKVDTVPQIDTHENAVREDKVYTLIKEAISKYAIKGSFVNHPITPSIRDQKEYTFPFYQETEEYSSRYNLLHIYNSTSDTRGIALNAHIDVVPPYFPPREEDGIIIGRGASDDKGCCVTIIGALMLLKEIEQELGISVPCPIVSMFVTDEESGGNGSLSVALDSQLAKKYETIIVCESTEGKLYPANRGALWFKIDILDGNPVDQLALMFHIVRGLEKAGKALRENSDHPLFPTKPVQTCEGILGGYGEHPARTCNLVTLEIKKHLIGRIELIDSIGRGLSNYISTYSDRTKSINPSTNKPKILSHYSLNETKDSFLLEIYGTSIHMGKALEYDSAIVKSAWITAPLYEKYPDLGIVLYGHTTTHLTLEGGQGFLPTHSIGQIKQILTEAVTSSYTNYIKKGDSLTCPIISFDKLHNDAYECNPASPSMKAMIEAAIQIGIKGIEPIEGFPVSCDARIFAHRYPDKEVITCGPGTISFAHTDNEQISIEEITLGATQLALSILLMSGSIDKRGCI